MLYESSNLTEKDKYTYNTHLLYNCIGSKLNHFGVSSHINIDKIAAILNQ